MYSTFADDDEALTQKWLEATGRLFNNEIEVRPIGINRWCDGIEIWRVGADDEGNLEGVLAMCHFPITRGDVRKLCWALNVSLPAYPLTDAKLMSFEKA